MDILKSIAKVSTASDEERNYLLHEIKYALLGTILLFLFLTKWSDKFIISVFPAAMGPIKSLYKGMLFIALYYIIQKTDWFQNI